MSVKAVIGTCVVGSIAYGNNVCASQIHVVGWSHLDFRIVDRDADRVAEGALALISCFGLAGQDEAVVEQCAESEKIGSAVGLKVEIESLTFPGSYTRRRP